METFNIAAYCRISVDEEADRDNTSIENQKAIIGDFAAKKFPGSALTFFEDRDKSGYTFEQRDGYQKMRPQLMSHGFDMLIVKDFSRFARRNSRGLVELEDLRDAGLRIISIGDSIDYPTYDDWTAIQFRFLINEMPVTDASKKVKSVINRRQNDGKWICAVPYGYLITNSKTMSFEIDDAASQVVRKIFELYNQGWGYQKIANHLSALHIPTPRSAEKQRKEEQGEENKIRARPSWSIATVQGILENDFYIGTLRQGKYARRKINGADVKKESAEHIVFENHHPPIVDFRSFAQAREQHRLRTNSNYRGVKKHDNAYSGFLFCGDCASPMFSMSRADLKPAYTCGSYHRRGLTACSSHHTRVDVLDDLLKAYIRKVKENSADMLEQLNLAIKNESTEIKSNEDTRELLQRRADDAYEELKATKRQRVRDIMKHPEREEILEQTYDEMEAELEDKISGLQNQLELTLDKRNNIIQVNRIARTAMDIFDELLQKEKLDKQDLELIIDKITVFEDHIQIKLKADIDALLNCGAPSAQTAEELTANFNFGIVNSSQNSTIVQSSHHRRDKVYDVNVISEGDPLEIYTEKDGEVIFKKYSPVGELSEFAAKICEALYKSGGCVAAVCDRDSIIACAGAPKRELMDKRISNALSEIMASRKLYASLGSPQLPFAEDEENYFITAAAPVLSEGDVMGCVVFAAKTDAPPPSEVQTKLVATVAGFLGKQL
ncbi:MAG: stage V sporulation T C-terminal domain-containing protein, partial [Oscillospiraceae bacterium]